jgi:uncharacterized membrane protein
MKTTLLRGKPLAIAALVLVIEHPAYFDQIIPPHPKRKCGCYLHHVIKLSGAIFDPAERDGARFAARLLSISILESDKLYVADNTLPDLKRLVKEIFGVKQVTLTNGEVVKL